MGEDILTLDINNILMLDRKKIDKKGQVCGFTKYANHQAIIIILKGDGQ